MTLQGDRLSAPTAGRQEIEQVLLGLADGCYALSTPDGAVAECGAGVAGLLGVPAHKLVGRPAADVLVPGADDAVKDAFGRLLDADGVDAAGSRTFRAQTASGPERSLRFLVVAVPLALAWEFTSLLSELGSRDAGTWHLEVLRMRHGRALEAIEDVVRDGTQPDPDARLAGILIIVRDVDAPILTREDVDRRMADQRADAGVAAAESARRNDEAAGRRASGSGRGPVDERRGLEDLVERARILRERLEEAEHDADAARSEREDALDKLAYADAARDKATARVAALQAGDDGRFELLMGERDEFRSCLEGARRELASARTEVEATRAGAEAIQAELAAARAAAEAARAEVVAARADVQAARAEAQAATAAAEAAQSEAQAARVDAQAARAETSATRAPATSAGGTAQSEAQSARADADRAHAADRELEVARAETQTARSELHAARGEAQAAAVAAGAARADAESAEAGALRAELQTARSERQAARTELQTARDELHAAHGESSLARGEASAIRTELQGTCDALEQARGELEAVRAEHDCTRAELDTSLAAAAEIRAEREQAKVRAGQLLREAERARVAADAIRAEFAFDTDPSDAAARLPGTPSQGLRSPSSRPAPSCAQLAVPADSRPDLPPSEPGQAAALIALDGSFKRLDEAFCSLLGCREEDLRSARWPSIIDRDNLQAHQELARALTAGEIESAEVETVYMHAQGLLVPIAGTVSMHRADPGGEPTHFLFRADVRRTAGVPGVA